MKSIARSFAYFTSASAVGTVTQVAKGKLGAILLGTAGVGILNQLTTFWTLAQIVSGLGFNVGIVRSVARSVRENDQEEMRRHLSSVILFLGLIALVVTFVCIWFSAAISHILFVDGGARAELVEIMVLAVPIAVLANIYKSVLSGSQSVAGIVRSQVIGDVSSVIAFWILAVSAGVRGAAMAFVVFQAVLLAARLVFAAQRNGLAQVIPSVKGFRWEPVHANAVYGINALITTGVHAVALLFISRLIIARFGLPDNGVFSVAMKVGTLFLAGVYASSGSVFFPSLVAAPKAEFDDLVARTLFFYMTVLPPLIVVLILAGPVMITLMFSREFAYASVLMMFLLIADFLKLITETIGLALVARDRIVLITASYLVFAALLAVFSLVFVHHLGLLGICLAFIGAQLVHLAVVWYLARRILDLHLPRTTLASVARGLVLLTAVAGFLLYLDGGVTRLAVGVVLTAVWFAAGWPDAHFREIASRPAKVLRRWL